MKKYVLGLFAVVLAIGISSFGTTNTNKLTKTKVYYAIKTGTSFAWIQTMPDIDEFQCVTDRTPYCEITVADNFTPTDGVLPAAKNLLDHTSVNSQHELIP